MDNGAVVLYKILQKLSTDLLSRNIGDANRPGERAIRAGTRLEVRLRARFGGSDRS